MEVHEKIKFIRLFRGWSQEQMAEKLGMVLNGYAKIEQGKVDINLSRLKQIAETLEVEVAQLVGLSEKNIFNFIENHNGSIHQQHHSSNTIIQSDCQHELEKARLVIGQKEQEILYLKEIIALMKKIRKFEFPHFRYRKLWLEFPVTLYRSQKNGALSFRIIYSEFGRFGTWDILLRIL